jgi:ABC-2 type transport system ATP-binding protein
VDAPVIEVRGLRKAYGAVEAVRDVSFEVRRGEIVGILGPNGAGKTTSVEILTGLRTADAGHVRVLGVDPRHDRALIRAKVGVQLQEGELAPKITVTEALELFASFYPDPADGIDLATGLGLGEVLDTRYRDLSGGQKQRLAIALALIGRPEVAVLDELTTGLDPQARREVWDLIAEVRDSGVTIVLVTHFMDEAERLCDRVVVIDRGVVVATDTPAGLAAGAERGQVLRFRTAGSPAEEVPALLAGAPGVDDVHVARGEVVVHGRDDVVLAVVRALDAAGVVPVDLDVRRTTLEDAFVRLVADEEA